MLQIRLPLFLQYWKPIEGHYNRYYVSGIVFAPNKLSHEVIKCFNAIVRDILQSIAIDCKTILTIFRLSVLSTLTY